MKNENDINALSGTALEGKKACGADSPGREVQYRVQQSKTPACMSCPARSKCTKAKY